MEYSSRESIKSALIKTIKMKILILGGSGFIGSHLVDELIKNNHDLRILGRSKYTFIADNPKVEYIQGEVSSTKVLKRAVKGIDLIYHLVSSTVPSTANLDPISDISFNLINMIKLLDQMIEANVKKLIFFSSGGTVYGNSAPVPTPETAMLSPTSSYGIVKVAIESYIKMYHQLHGLDYIIVRPSNPYGPRQNTDGTQGVISSFLSKIIHKQTINVWGNGSVERDYLFISDLTNACSSMVTNFVPGVYNIGAGQCISLNRLIDIISKVTNSTIDIEYTKSPKYDIPKVQLDISHTQKIFNWKPKIGLHEGIKRQYEWLLKQQL